MTPLRTQTIKAVTGFGAGDSLGRGGFLCSGAFHLLLGRGYGDKDLQERIVRRSKLDWVIRDPQPAPAISLSGGPPMYELTPRAEWYADARAFRPEPGPA